MDLVASALWFRSCLLFWVSPITSIHQQVWVTERERVWEWSLVRLLLQQHQYSSENWPKKQHKQLSHNVLYRWETPPTSVLSRATEGNMWETILMQKSWWMGLLLYVSVPGSMHKYGLGFLLTVPPVLCALLIACQRSRLCRDHLFSLTADPFAPAGHGHMASLKQTSPPPVCCLLLTVSVRSFQDGYRWCKRHRNAVWGRDRGGLLFCGSGQVEMLGGLSKDREELNFDQLTSLLPLIFHCYFF